MEQLYVESKKRYIHGFILKESDLRRITDLMADQFKKISNNEVSYTFNVKFKNGAFAKTPDIESVLSLDNEGSSSIVGLDVTGVQLNDERESEIKLSFQQFDSSADEIIRPIKHSIKGESRDWVFVTSSLMEERIGKIKRRQMNPSAATGSSRMLIRIGLLIVMWVMMVLMLFSVSTITQQLNSGKIKTLDVIERKWKTHQINDPVDALIQINRLGLKSENEVNMPLVMGNMLLARPMLIAFAFILIFTIVGRVFLRFYPACNFYWGGYVEIFDKKENARKILIGVVLGTIGLGVVVNLLSNVIWERI